MTAAQIEQRRANGIAVREKYGAEHFRLLGKLGGRPRLKTLAELKQEKLNGGMEAHRRDLFR